MQRFFAYLSTRKLLRAVAWLNVAYGAWLSKEQLAPGLLIVFSATALFLIVERD